ncbi:TetR/AcrR family transcriptional regulator [Parablautia intestinalis]|jgi:AcrR family transcriptional regulator|uniref:TetR/AcrR family transcriptional regulator n=1 Tax=Parablautia intestinalis TaxID=2320100 RepID=A0A3A9AI39_9FIRM|nr:TetR/AcrR family transcriptional regulator [Parablautia intestinalis]RKI91260.1 TetR/AcrR family transcriptional regulator [Parablautia intestinalis]
MSPVFPLKQRQQIHTELLKTGIQLICEKGVRKLTIDEVTQRVQIGKGTFYHFFTSKELFVYEAIMFSKEAVLKKINEAVEKYGALDRQAVDELLSHFSLLGQNNIISSLSMEDEIWLSKKLPPEYILDPPKEEKIVDLLFQNMKDIRSDIHSHVVANMIKIMAITVENRNFLHEDVIAENMNILKDSFLDYLFGRE